MTTEQNLVVESEDTIESPSHKGTGLNDLTISGDFTGTSETAFRIKISEANPTTADEFSVSTDGGATYGSPITMDGTAQSIGSGISATFASKRGHTLNDLFDFRAFGAKSLDAKDVAGDSALSVNPDGSIDTAGALNVAGNLAVTGVTELTGDISADNATFTGDISGATIAVDDIKATDGTVVQTLNAAGVLIKGSGAGRLYSNNSTFNMGVSSSTVGVNGTTTFVLLSPGAIAVGNIGSTGGHLGSRLATSKITVSDSGSGIGDGTVAATFTATTGIKPIKVTSLPTADATNVGSIVNYETGSGGTLAITPVASVCVAGAYKWVYLTSGSDV